MSVIIAPSLLAADFTNLESDLKMINESDAEWLHLDVMDGRFVPNISFGPMIIEAASRVCTKVLDVHLMIVEPEKYIDDFRKAGADWISVHYEACPHLHRTLGQIKDTGAKAGVVLNPSTPVNVLSEVIEDADLVLLMSVNPGFGGQKFIYRTLAKIKELKTMIIERNSPAIIQVDGGVGLQNAAQIVDAGADCLVAGSSVFKSENPKETISKLSKINSDNFVL